MTQETLFTQSTTSREQLSVVLESIHNHLYANEGLSPEQALEETVKLLFMKFNDELTEARSFYISEYEINTDNTTTKMSSFEARINNLFNEVVKKFPDVFESTDRLRLTTSSLAFAVLNLQNIELSRLPHDVKGVAFQKFLSSSQRVGRGQFFTPEPVVELCVSMLSPQNGEVILDPACGSAGFLSSAYLQSIESGADSKCIPIGIEISKTAARLARMRLLLLGIQDPAVIQKNALLSSEEICAEFASRYGLPYDSNTGGIADIIVTNPPFGTQGKIDESSFLKRFDLGHRLEIRDAKIHKGEILKNQIPEILFIEQCLNLLKPGGRMGIVLPNGEFENSSLKYVRDYVLHKSTIDAVIKLPDETFIPSGTGIKTSLLFITKRSVSNKSSKDIFFGEVTKLGYSGNKHGTTNYKRDSSGNTLMHANSSLQIDEDISDILSTFRSKSANNLYPANENMFLADSELITSERFDLNFHHPKYQELIKKLLGKNGIPLSTLVELNKQKSLQLSDPSNVVRYVELSDVSNQYGEIVNSETLSVFDLPSRATYEIATGDLITAVAGNSIGTANHVSAFVNEEFDGCVCSNGFRVLKVDQDLIDPLYLLFFFSTKEFQDQIFRLRTGAAIPAISDSDFLSILVPRLSASAENDISQLIQSGYNARRDFRTDLAEQRNAYQQLLN